MQTALTPAMQQLAPAIVDATNSLAKIVTWATGDRQLQNITDKVNQDVPGAITSTDKQIAGGVISAPQMDADKIAEKEARERMSRASAEYEQKKQEEEAEKNNPTANHRLETHFDDLFGTDTSGDKGRAAGVAEAKTQLEAARKSFQDMLGENAKVAELLRTHTIRVVVTNPSGKPALSSPKDGVEGPPGDR
jgi:regulator of protease activity HflC (stomatin/prohibitin superfamily)